MGLALVFPGQGSQHVGMGKALAEAFPSARAVFEEVDDALGQKLSTIMWEGPEESLTLTENAQPALMAVSIAALRALEAELGRELARLAEPAGTVRYVAGHSLGEYSALAAAGAFTLADTARLLRTRGRAMQEAVPVGEGAMAALLGIGLEGAQKLAEAAASKASKPGGEVCQVANDNAPTQVVLSGDKAAIERAVAMAKDYGARRAVLLNVSAPFHSALMAPAAKVMEEALAEVAIRPPEVPLIANVTATETRDVEAIRGQLVAQVTGTVRWRESVAYMASKGVGRVLEVGAGKVLSGLVRQIDRTLTTAQLGVPEDLDAVTALFKA